MEKHYRFMRLSMLISGILLVAISCSTSGPDEFVDPVCGLASPMVFNSDTTFLDVQDYISHIDLVDTILFPAQIKVEGTSEESVLKLVKTTDLPLLSAFTIKLKSADKVEVLIKYRQKKIMKIQFPDKGKKYNSVRVRGEMNFWNALSSKMKFTDGIWEEEFELSPGEYQYLLLADGDEMLNPEAEDSIDNNMGGFNSLIRVGKYKPEELPFVRTSQVYGNSVQMESDRKLSTVFIFWQNQLIPHRIEGNQIVFSIPAEASQIERSWLRVYAANEDGFSNDLLIPIDKGNIVKDVSLLTRFDRQTMIMYFMMIDRFRNGDPGNDEKVNDPTILPKANYFGGDLEGVLQTMEDGYFMNLGVNTIWLSPITQNPRGAYGLYPDPKTRFSGYHGYWPVSSTKIDYRFGSPANLDSIVSLAHRQQQNVLLDYVANHVHKEHPVYQKHPDWATELYLPDGSLNTEKWDEYRLTTWFDTFLPTLDLRKPEVVEPMTDSALYWITRYGIDGFRHDATKHIDELFWRTLTSKLKEATNCDPPVYQIGETYGSPELINSYISTGMLDGQFDFNLYDNAVATFARDGESFVRLKNALSQSLQYYGYHNLMGNITGNQDRPRFISLAGGDLRFDEDTKRAGWKREVEVGDPSGYDKLKMLHAFNLTIPGIPVIYYGDEFGLPGANDPDNRRWMKFEDLSNEETEVKNTVKQLTGLRNTNMALLFGDLQFIQVDTTTMAYRRSYFNEEVIVIFNKSDEAVKMTIEMQAEDGKFVPHFGSIVSIEKRILNIEIPARSFEIITNSGY